MPKQIWLFWMYCCSCCTKPGSQDCSDISSKLIRVISCRLLSMLRFPCSRLSTEVFRVYKWEINGSSWPNYLLRYRPESFLVGSWQDAHFQLSLLWMPLWEATLPFTNCSYFRMVLFYPCFSLIRVSKTTAGDNPTVFLKLTCSISIAAASDIYIEEAQDKS